MDKNQQVLAIAFKKAKRKLQRIAELNITPKMTEKAIDKLVVDLATAKAVEAKEPVEGFIDGQQWYVESLVKASALTDQALLDAEYDDSFADVAGEDEMCSALAGLRAA